MEACIALHPNLEAALKLLGDIQLSHYVVAPPSEAASDEQLPPTLEDDLDGLFSRYSLLHACVYQ